MAVQKRLRRSRNERVIAGVCGGLGEYFGLDPVILRILWLVLVLAYGTGVIAYIICWIAMPERRPGEEAPA
jgi:phage shock protein C